MEFSTLRRQAGFEIDELANELGVPASAVLEWEAGASNAPQQILRTLDLLGSFSRNPNERIAPQSFRTDRSGSFTDNMKLPVHRWFRYSAGFSAQWVESLVAEHLSAGADGMLFDPFAGSATSLVAAQALGLESAGAERHPFVARIATAKLRRDIDTRLLRERATALVRSAMRIEKPIDDAPDLLRKCYSEISLLQLFALRTAFDECADRSDPVDELLWLALTSILRECSHVGTAQWQYVLPNKSKAKVAQPFDAFRRKIDVFCSDVLSFRSNEMARSNILTDDARTLREFGYLRDKVGLIVTSPPYPNNYDYADATRLEMTFWGEIHSWGGLQETVRSKLVRSCSQHTAAERLQLDELLSHDAIRPIADDLRAVTEELGHVRLGKGGKKTYHTMVAAYFVDLANVWKALRPLCRSGAKICFVVGDSAPYGVHVPVEKWLAKLAVSAGFSSPEFRKLRDRNIKWKNRKHRVPLKEGQLWLRG